MTGRGNIRPSYGAAMTEGEARHRLRELVRMRVDVERFQRAQSALVLCPELKSSAPQQLSAFAQAAKTAADRLEAELVRLLTGTHTVMWSDGDVDIGSTLGPGSTATETTPRV